MFQQLQEVRRRSIRFENRVHVSSALLVLRIHSRRDRFP